MKKFREDLQAVTKEFKALTKKIGQLTTKVTKTAVGQLEEAQAAITLKSPAQHAAGGLKALTKQTEKLIKAVDKLEKQKAAAKRKAKPKAKPKTKKASAKKKVTAKKPTPARKKAAKPTAADQVLRIVKRSKKGANTATLMKKTGLGETTVRNILYKASKAGKIKRIALGVYVAA
jgi:hypothetical protein